jgi:hypothetical protein
MKGFWCVPTQEKRKASMPRKYFLLIAVLFAYSSSIVAATLSFDYTALISGSDRPGAPNGTLLTGHFSYDPAKSNPFGSYDYYPDAGSSTLYAKGVAGFSLSRDTRVINVTPGATTDRMTIQSFVSEEPNGWNMVFDFIEPGGPTGWLQGDSNLPTVFPANLDNAFITLYFTDEGDWTRVVEATILSVSPSVVPVPAAAWLFGSALLGLGVMTRKTVSGDLS